ncbi:hypothetical protein, partial [Streptomyces sp. H27-H5]
MTVGSEAGVTIRSYAPGDLSRVLALIAGDRLPGRPVVTASMLTHAVTGPGAGPGDPGAGVPAVPGTVLAVSAGGEVLGAAAWAVRRDDGDGLLLWSHCVDDDQEIAGLLVRHVLERLGRRTVRAFACATAPGFAGLPVRSRRGTAVALETAGFSRQEGWTYLHHRLDPHSPRPYGLGDVIECADPRYGWYVRLWERDGSLVGKATVTRPVEGASVLEWIALMPRRGGFGHGVLERCLAPLVGHGVREVVTLLDTAEPGDSAVRDLHDRAGFRE